MFSCYDQYISIFDCICCSCSIIQIAIMILLNSKNLIKTKRVYIFTECNTGRNNRYSREYNGNKCMGMDNAVKSNLQNSYTKLIENSRKNWN